MKWKDIPAIFVCDVAIRNGWIDLLDWVMKSHKLTEKLYQSVSKYGTIEMFEWLKINHDNPMLHVNVCENAAKGASYMEK
jgi:hypothetical protein